MERLGGHDFIGSFSVDQDGRKIRPQVSKEFLRINFFLNALKASEKVSSALKSLVDSWDTVPQPQNIKPGDQILYRSQGKVSNIHDRLNTEAQIYEVKAFPSIVKSTNLADGKIVSVNTSELRFTSFRNPHETLSTYMKDVKTYEQAIKQMKKVGYLEEVPITLQASDIRLFSDVNQFLVGNFGLTLGLSSQDHEFLY